MAVETFPVILEEVKSITPKVKHFAFRRKDGAVFDWIPGQFISIHFEQEGKPIRRSYSVATMPKHSDLIEFAAAYVEGGPASELLFNLEVGAELNFSGPYGRLILREETIKRCFLIATGTGVTPYRSMLPQILATLELHPDREFWILLGVQYGHDQLYAEDFLAFSKQHPGLHFRTYHSRDALEGAKAYEFKGYVQTALDELKPDAATDVVYLCGNPNMIDDSYELLKELGFSAQQVRREKYVS